jgi:Ca2+-binding RTX toxin-like protein
VVGGFGNDVITTGAGADIVLGDNGAVTYTPGTTLPALAMTTDIVNATGGNDIIATGGGDNIVLAGVGADTVTAGAGSDLVMGDNGVIAWTPEGDYSQFATEEDPALDGGLGAGDVILVGDGNNIVLGGFGADVIETGVGTDLVLGDNGLFQYTNASNVPGDAVLTLAQTTDTIDQPLQNWDDVIVSGGGAGDNIVLAGFGNDLVNVQGPNATDPAAAVSSGTDIVLGDNGFVQWDNTGLITQFVSTEPDLGGNDQIAVGDGANIVVGGFGNDVITTGAGADIVLGDNGAVTYTPGTTLPALAMTTDIVNATGGNDIIATGGGDNIVLAGVGADTVTAGAGSDLVMGDNGVIAWTPEGDYSQFATEEDPALDGGLGAGDVILVGDGNNIVLGGFGADVIETGVGTDLVLGDNGLFQYTNASNVPGDAVLTLAQTTDTIDQPLQNWRRHDRDSRGDWRQTW